eukprot:gene1499-32877_t
MQLPDRLTWNELTPVASPGATKHKLHVHIYDEADFGIECAHVHPEETAPPQGGDATFTVAYTFPHPGEYVINMSWSPDGGASRQERYFRVDLL